MKRLAIFSILIFSLLIVDLPLSQQTRGMKAVGKAQKELPGVVYRTGWALLIGINKYPNLAAKYQLNFAVDDAEAFAELLIRRFGFPENNVTVLKDEQATKSSILEAFASLADPDRIKENDCVLVFYAGHGQTVERFGGGTMGFLIPHDAKIDLSKKPKPNEYYLSCISMDELYRISGLVAAKHILFILDACYSGGVIAGERGLDTEVPGYMEKVAKASVQQMITGGSKGEETIELPEKGHGVFSYKMIEGLENGIADWDNNGIITGSELGNYLRMTVPKMNPKQTPKFGMQGEGEFLFLSQVEAELEEPEVITEITELASKATLFVSSKPDGASVYVDEQMLGRTPCTIKVDAGVAGKREVIVAILEDGYETKRYKVTLTAGKQEKLENINLVRLAVPLEGPQTSISTEPQIKEQPTIIELPGPEPEEIIYVDDMVLIPAGDFQMGGGTGGHTVYLDDFLIDKYEVTNAQYAKFMEATDHPAPANWKDKNLNIPEHPVVGVSWNDAKAYCQWDGKRLPTEAEWEKAARGGLIGMKYSWGDDVSNAHDKANIFSKNGNDIWTYTAPVGSYDANGYGLFDMAGNAREWCEDIYDWGYYSKSPLRNPKGPDTGSQRVVRDGCWKYDASYLVVWKRQGRSPTSKYDEQGFRCARDAKP